ncbi:MAG: EcsC family protein [Myxococcales bacterium]|nr:EcsC family protein [Myxococcales bacterium]
MSETDKADEAKGKQLLTAVERLVASSDTIREMVLVADARAKARAPEATKAKDTLREVTAKELIRTYSNRAAIAGGATAVPALIPGLGSLAAGVAGTFAELAYLLKCEVELCLALSHLYGFDIDEPKERQLAFLLASVGTYDAGGRNFFADMVKAEGVAIWNYGPRTVGKWLLKAMTALALVYLWRGFIKMVPILGIVIGSGVNKVLTKRVGERVMADLRTRRDLMEGPGSQAPKARRPQKKKTGGRKPPRKPRLKVVAPGA